MRHAPEALSHIGLALNCLTVGALSLQLPWVGTGTPGAVAVTAADGRPLTSSTAHSLNSKNYLPRTCRPLLTNQDLKYLQSLTRLISQAKAHVFGGKISSRRCQNPLGSEYQIHPFRGGLADADR